jgi:hypothetical protein
MATQIGIVKALIGTATATATDGTSRNLQVGDSVYADELVTTGAGGAVELEFADGSVMDLGRDSQALLDNAVFNPEALAESAATAESDADAIQAAILAGADPTQVTEATAAGAGTQADSNEGHQPVVIDYLAPQVTPESGFDTTGISVEFPVIEEELQAPIAADLNPPVDYDVNVTANFFEELPFEFNVGGIPATSMSVSLDNGDNSVGYIYFTVGSDANVSIAANGSGVDPQIHLFTDDGSLDLADLLASNDDGGPGFNSLINAYLPAGDYVLAVSDFSFSSDEAVSGDNTSGMPATGIYEVTIGSLSATIAINEGSSSDPSTATTGTYNFETDSDEIGAGFLYEFQVGENANIVDNIHGTDVEDGVTSDFTITTLPTDADSNQVGLLFVDRNDDGVIEEIYGGSYNNIPAGGLVIASGDSVYYYQPAFYGQGPGQDEGPSESEFSQPVPVTFNYFTTDSDGLVSDSAVVSIGFPTVPTPSVMLAGGEIQTISIDEDGSAQISVVADTNEGSHLDTMTIGGFNGDVDASWFDLSGLEVNAATASFGAGVITISGLSGTEFNGSFTITPPADSDVDAGGLNAQVTAVSDTDAGLVTSDITFLTVTTDAVADAVTVVITVVDSDDANTSFQIGEDGTITVNATFGDAADGSEIHTVVVTIPDGFSVGDDSSANSLTTNPDGTTTLVYTVTGTSLNDSFTVTNDGAADGTSGFSADVTAEETLFSGDEPDSADNIATDTDSAQVTVAGIPGPNVTLGSVDAGSLDVQEDSTTADNSIAVNATTTVGSSLTSITISGFDAAWTYDLSGLSGTVTNNIAGDGTITITGLAGVSYTGSIGVAPPADSDVDMGLLTASVLATNNTDNTITATDGDTLTVTADANADAVTVSIAVVDGGDADGSFQAGESGTATLAATFGDTTDGSETHTVVVTIPAGFSVSGVTGGVVSGSTITYSSIGAALDDTFTVTNDSAVDGTPNFSVVATATETTTGDVETNTADADNIATDTDSAQVTVAGIPGPSVTLAGAGADDFWLKEDGAAVSVNVSASTNTGSALSNIVITGFQSGFTYDFSGLEVGGATVDSSVAGQITISGLPGLSYSSASFTVQATTEDSDADLGTLTATVTAANTTDSSVTNTAQDTATLKTDAVVDAVTLAVSVADSNDEGGSFQVGESGTVNVAATFSDSADNSETHTVVIDIPTGFSVTGVSGGTYNSTAQTVTYENIGSSLTTNFTLTNDSAIAGTFNLTSSATALDEATVVGPNANGSGAEQTEVDNTVIVNDSDEIIVNNQPSITNLTPQVDGGDVTVDEDDLLASRGVGEHDGSDSDKESTTQIGTFTIEAIDGVDDLTIDGRDIIVNGSFTATSFTTDLGNTLSVTGYVNGEITYSYTLEDNTTMHPTANGENSVFENFAVVLTDSDGDITSDILSVQIVDDVPTATPATNNGELTQAVDTNLMLILDVSGSMGDDADYQGMSRLEVMVKSSMELLDQYESYGDVMVNIVSFSSSGANPTNGWVSVAQAKTILLGLNDGGSTNFDDALNDAINAFGASGKLDTANSQNISYFMSDGNPTANSVSNLATIPGGNNDLGGTNGIQSDEQADWERFLTNNDIKSFGLGMGTGINQGNLEPIAFDGSTGTNIGAITVTDLSQLLATLTSTIVVPAIVGDLLNGGVPAIAGADDAWIQSITVDGITYKYDQVLDTSSVSGGTSNGNFDNGTNEWTVTTPEGGELVVDMDTGDYAYTSSTGISATTIENFGYTVIDGDGDTASSTLTITVDPAGGPQVVRDDFVITNQDPTEIPDWALLANDQPSNGSLQALTGVSDAVSGSVTDNANDTVTFTDADGSFVYTNTSGAQSDTGTVLVDHVTGTILTGSYLDEILIGGTASETLNGGAGNDILIGGDGVVIPSATQRVRITADGNDGSNNTGYLQFAMLAGTASILSIVIDVRGGSDSNSEFSPAPGGGDYGPDFSNLSGLTGSDISTSFSSNESVMTMVFDAGKFSSGDSFDLNVKVTDLGGNDGDDFGSKGVTATVIFSDGTVQTLVFDKIDNNTSIAETSVLGNVDDTLDGGEGDDILVGGIGNDILTGGDGADQFIWKDGDTGTDSVIDFNAGEGDVLNLADLLDPTAALDIGGADNLDNYLKATFDNGTNTTSVDVYTGGDANAAGTISQSILINGDVHDLTSLLGTNNLIVDQ